MVRNIETKLKCDCFVSHDVCERETKRKNYRGNIYIRCKK